MLLIYVNNKVSYVKKKMLHADMIKFISRLLTFFWGGGMGPFDQFQPNLTQIGVAGLII